MNRHKAIRFGIPGEGKMHDSFGGMSKNRALYRGPSYTTLARFHRAFQV
ncbi:MAG: hypothetical protein GY753_19160 [Gammaproteobacteria bacterium]|nr:hypothetical protein [Gammaproteobacteria bacterium]